MRVSERDRDRGFLSIGSLLKARTSSVWARQKLGVQDSVLVPCVDDKNSSTGAISCCLLRCTLTGSWTRRQNWNLNLGTLIWNAASPLCQMPSPSWSLTVKCTSVRSLHLSPMGVDHIAVSSSGPQGKLRWLRLARNVC